MSVDSSTSANGSGGEGWVTSTNGMVGFHPSRSSRHHLRTLAFVAGLPLSRVEEVLELVELSARPRSSVFRLDWAD